MKFVLIALLLALSGCAAHQELVDANAKKPPKCMVAYTGFALNACPEEAKTP